MQNYGAIKFAVGDKILMEFSTFGDRFLSVITDIGKDGQLFVYAPVTPPIIQRFKIDRYAKVRFAHEGLLYGFDTKVLNEVESAGTILELKKPVFMYDAEDRCEPRCSCRFPATVVDGERAAQAVVEDMSTSCSRVRFLNGGLVPFVEDTDTEVQLTFHAFDMGEKYSVNCVVRNAFMKDGVRYAILEFNPDECEACDRIAQFVEAQICCGIPRL